MIYPSPLHPITAHYLRQILLQTAAYWPTMYRVNGSHQPVTPVRHAIPDARGPIDLARYAIRMHLRYQSPVQAPARATSALARLQFATNRGDQTSLSSSNSFINGSSNSSSSSYRPSSRNRCSRLVSTRATRKIEIS